MGFYSIESLQKVGWKRGGWRLLAITFCSVKKNTTNIKRQSNACKGTGHLESLEPIVVEATWRRHAWWWTDVDVQPTLKSDDNLHIAPLQGTIEWLLFRNNVGQKQRRVANRSITVQICATLLQFLRFGWLLLIIRMIKLQPKETSIPLLTISQSARRIASRPVQEGLRKGPFKSAEEWTCDYRLDHE